MKDKKSLTVVIVVAVLALAVVGVVLALSGNKNSDTTSTMPMPESHTSQTTDNTKQTPQATSAVAIENFAFNPTSISVKVGSTVTWTNNDSTAHTVTADDGVSNGPNSGTLEKGKTYSFTFAHAGTFTYHCEFHPNMHGTVTVTE